jgi:hypothetical protein
VKGSGCVAGQVSSRVRGELSNKLEASLVGQS